MLGVTGAFKDGGKATKILTALLFVLLCNASFSQEYKKIKAKKGDGIYAVLKQNGLAPKEYFDLFIELNKGKLGKDHSLIIGHTYLLPVSKAKNSAVQAVLPVKEAAPVKKIQEIYGKDYHEVSIKSRELAGTVYYLVSGHGGPDPGAVGFLDNHMLCEDEYAYDVTLRLARNLTERGATVYMIIRDPDDGIRDDAFLKPDRDEVCYPNQQIPQGQLERLKQETEAVNKLYRTNKGKFQRMVVIHVDSRSKKENIDVFFYHKKGSKTGEKLAFTLKDTFGQRYKVHQPNRGYSGTVSHRNLYVINNSLASSVFIELGNINHKRDQQRFLIADNRQAVANWLRDGLMEEYKQVKRK
ncbi:MAG TPA: N-acetylmuramoyl-L-alanine amidase [Prolixibacteraceae bacterium]|nr:N-acetylmuramoyl-L-alanine amidase [Prolixibacteraceae bacterium]